MPILSAKNLVKKFGDFTALDGINLEVKKGEIYGFIGPNGAGKSTTIRILLGMIRATEGSIKIFNQDVWQDAVAIHQRIAYVPGDVNLWPNLTGGEVIDLFTALRGKNTTTRRDELIKAFDLDPSKKCRTYSKGNRQKIALIAAFAADADLYIFDEPTSGLDPLMEKVFQNYVLEAKARGKSFLLSSHILSEVERLCDTVSIIREGKIIETGSIKEMKHLTRVNLRVETREPMTTLEKMNGVHAIEHIEQSISFQVDNEALGSVMTYVSQHGIIMLESSPPTLEDLFMRHYTGTQT